MGLRRTGAVPALSGSCPSNLDCPGEAMDRPLVLVSRADPASVTIRDALLDAGDWKEIGAFHGLPIRERGELLLVEVEPLHLECDLVDRTLHDGGLEFDAVLVASKHRAESGKP